MFNSVVSCIKADYDIELYLFLCCFVYSQNVDSECFVFIEGCIYLNFIQWGGIESFYPIVFR